MARKHAEPPPPADKPAERAAWLRTELERANYQYYVLDQLEIPDAEYDSLFSDLRSSSNLTRPSGLAMATGSIAGLPLRAGAETACAASTSPTRTASRYTAPP